jgi:cytochrome c oxidase subunit 4
MSANQHDHTSVAHADEHHESMSKKRIWQVFFYLLALTALEFFIALALVHAGHIEKDWTVKIIYILLTLWKAYYIVAYFMHLKYETSGFILSITTSFILIVYFIVLMLIEGNYLKTNYNPFQFWPMP